MSLNWPEALVAIVLIIVVAVITVFLIAAIMMRNKEKDQ